MLVITACLIAATAAYGAGDRVESVKQVPAAAPNKHYISNRALLATSPLVKLPVGAIRPDPSLRGQLEVQADGFIGRLTEISPWCRAADNAWLSKEGTVTLPGRNCRIGSRSSATRAIALNHGTKEKDHDHTAHK